MSSTTEEASLDDALVPNQELPIRLPMFEGPLDLLLFLIRKNEVDIYDIPIESVTKQYLEIIHSMEKLNLEVAGEFFVMAATLMYIKSRMLLPTNEQAVQDEDEEEDVDPRWELVQQLLEYKKFKEAANQLEDYALNRQDLIPRFYKINAEDREARVLKDSDRIEIWNTFNLVLRRLAEQITKGEIQDEQVSIADRMEYLLEIIKTKKQFTFSSLFEGVSYSLNYLVSTFLAVLELTRLKRMIVEQSDCFQEIAITALPEERSSSSDLPSDEEDTESESLEAEDNDAPQAVESEDSDPVETPEPDEESPQPESIEPSDKEGLVH